jgi:cell division protein FtsB
MGIALEINRRLRPAWLPFLGITAAIYFGYHFVEGQRGLIAWMSLNERIEAAQIEHEFLLNERLQAEHRVSLLGPAGLDADMLDERARAVLGLARKDEIVLLGR